MGGPGSGSKPKVYDSGFVERVRALYMAGKTQDEIAVLLGTSQKVVWNMMRRHGIQRRVAAKRFQTGPMNHAWKGDDAKYAALHLRVATVRGTPSLCEHCGTTTAKRFEWASLSKRYNDVNDYVRLCQSCHHKMDGTGRNLGHYAKRKEVLP